MAMGAAVDALSELDLLLPRHRNHGLAQKRMEFGRRERNITGISVIF